MTPDGKPEPWIATTWPLDATPGTTTTTGAGAPVPESSPYATLPVESEAMICTDASPTVTGANDTVRLHEPPGGIELLVHASSDTMNAPSTSPSIEIAVTVTGALVGLVSATTVDWRPAATMVGENSTPLGTNETNSTGPAA